MGLNDKSEKAALAALAPNISDPLMMQPFRSSKPPATKPRKTASFSKKDNHYFDTADDNEYSDHDNNTDGLDDNLECGDEKKKKNATWLNNISLIIIGVIVVCLVVIVVYYMWYQKPKDDDAVVKKTTAGGNAATRERPRSPPDKQPPENYNKQPPPSTQNPMSYYDQPTGDENSERQQSVDNNMYKQYVKPVPVKKNKSAMRTQHETMSNDQSGGAEVLQTIVEESEEPGEIALTVKPEGISDTFRDAATNSLQQEILREVNQSSAVIDVVDGDGGEGGGEGDDDEEPQFNACEFLLTSGKRRGKACGRRCTGDSFRCPNHIGK